MIHVRNWEKFQHADVTKRGRPPAWIRLYTELLSDENYLRLTPNRRAMLTGIWIEYARTRRELPEDTASLSRRLVQRVLKSDLIALRDGGFITLDSAEHTLSNSRAHAEHTPSPRAPGDEDTPSTTTTRLNQAKNPESCHDGDKTASRLEERRGDQELQPAVTTDLEVTQEAPTPTSNIVALDEHRRGEINGRPLGAVVEETLAALRAAKGANG